MLKPTFQPKTSGDEPNLMAIRILCLVPRLQMHFQMPRTGKFHALSAYDHPTGTSNFAVPVLYAGS